MVVNRQTNAIKSEINNIQDEVYEKVEEIKNLLLDLKEAEEDEANRKEDYEESIRLTSLKWLGINV